MADDVDWRRYDRQVRFAPLGMRGQKALRLASALIVGVGGLGSWMAELLARAGVGMVRLVDGDVVDLTNIHRQGLYDEADAGKRKVHAAAERLSRVNSQVRVEPMAEVLTPHNIERLAAGVNAILDGTDNFQVRFVINDFAVKTNMPWVFAGAIGAEGQVMPVVPGQTACLRCIFDSPPPPCVEPTCRVAGVLGPPVAAIAAIAACEAVKILAGNLDAVSGHLVKLDFWTNTIQRIDAASAARAVNCPCCKQRRFEYLES